MALVPREQWTMFAHRLIWHGRRVCHREEARLRALHARAAVPERVRAGAAEARRRAKPKPARASRKADAADGEDQAEAEAEAKRSARVTPVVAVGAFVFDAAGRVLLVERGTPPGDGLWTVPGGKLEPARRSRRRSRARSARRPGSSSRSARSRASSSGSATTITS